MGLTSRPMPENTRYLVLGCKPWNRRLFDESLAGKDGIWRFLAAPAELSLASVRDFNPRYLFFLHWSWIVPTEIVDAYECVCFHMTDVPFGRGGSPLQNLIARGYRETKLTALRMAADLDAGPVYLKRPMSLEGGAEEIYLRSTRLALEMIEEIVKLQPHPQPQVGEPVVFKRRKPEDSRIPASASLEQLHDHIRMLDAEGYPPAFLVLGGFRYEFTRSALRDGRIVADVKITPADKKESEE